jgi:hypothetical protein
MARHFLFLNLHTYLTYIYTYIGPFLQAWSQHAYHAIRTRNAIIHFWYSRIWLLSPQYLYSQSILTSGSYSVPNNLRCLHKILKVNPGSFERHLTPELSKGLEIIKKLLLCGDILNELVFKCRTCRFQFPKEKSMKSGAFQWSIKPLNDIAKL